MYRGNLAFFALAAGSVLGSSALAGPNPRMMVRPAAGGSGDATVVLSNNVTGDGYLRVDPDEFGAVTVWSNPANYDYYDPAGAQAVGNPSFASSVFLFSGTDRVALCDPTSDLQTSYNTAAAYPATLVATLTSPAVTSDFDGDTVHDTANSTFTVTGGSSNLNLTIQLRQRVTKPTTAGSSVARFQQVYTVTNNAASPANIKFLYHKDLDMLWIGAALDPAGTVASGGVILPYQREPGATPTTDPTITGLVSPTTGYVYYAGRSGFDPDGAGPDPAMAYGTDYQIWQAYGLPTSWENYTAGIGHAPTTGELPDEMPAGGASPNDSFMGMQWTLSIPASGQRVIDVTTVYGGTGGQTTPPCYANCDGSTTTPILNVGDFTCFLQKFAAADAYANCDGSTTPPILNVGDFTCFLQKFAAGCQ